MSARQILVDVSEGGEVTIEAVGFKGGVCEKFTAPIEAALGVVKGRKRKPEYYAAGKVAGGQTVGGAS